MRKITLSHVVFNLYSYIRQGSMIKPDVYILVRKRKFTRKKNT